MTSLQFLRESLLRAHRLEESVTIKMRLFTYENGDETFGHHDEFFFIFVVSPIEKNDQEIIFKERTQVSPLKKYHVAPFFSLHLFETSLSFLTLKVKMKKVGCDEMMYADDSRLIRT